MTETNEIPYGHIACEDCDGTGEVTCGHCEGAGFTRHECDRGYEHEEDCSCDHGKAECYECLGSGYVQDPDIDTDEGL